MKKKAKMWKECRWWGFIDWLKPGHEQKCDAFAELTGTSLRETL